MEAKEFTYENIDEWKYDLISEEVKNEAKDRLKKYEFGTLDNFQNIDSVKLYSEVDPQEIAILGFADKEIISKIEYIHSINDLINIVGREEVNRVVKEALWSRIKTLKKVEGEYKAMLEFFADPSDQAITKLKKAIPDTHPNHEYAFSVSSANILLRARYKQNIRTGKYLFSSMINEDVIDASTEYQEIRCSIGGTGRPLFTRIDRWSKGFILYVMNTYESILEGYKDYFVNLIKPSRIFRVVGS